MSRFPQVWRIHLPTPSVVTPTCYISYESLKLSPGICVTFSIVNWGQTCIPILFSMQLYILHIPFTRVNIKPYTGYEQFSYRQFRFSIVRSNYRILPISVWQNFAIWLDFWVGKERIKGVPERSKNNAYGLYSMIGAGPPGRSLAPGSI